MAKKTPEDPTGVSTERGKMYRAIRDRLAPVEKQIKAEFRKIPSTKKQVKKIVNAEVTDFYEYEISEEGIEQIEALLGFLLVQQLLGGSASLPFNWFLSQTAETVYRKGMAEEVRDFNQMVQKEARKGLKVRGLPPQQVDPQAVLLSEPYRMAVNKAKGEAFLALKGLSEATSNQVMQTIRAGIRAGQSSAVVAKQITERFDVSRSRAQTISQTEINKSYNNAKMQGTRIMADQVGLRAGVIHVSALSTTTRDSHAFRHGNAYTVVDQERWWDEGANRINCKCTVRSVLVDSDGNVVQKDVLEKFKEEKKFFQNA